MDVFLTVMLFATMVVESPASIQETCTRSRCACHVPITEDQRLSIDEFQSSLVNMSLGELEEIVYNRTTPVIELTEDQEMKLLARHPAFFRAADSSDAYRNSTIDNPFNNVTLERRKRNVHKTRVCSSELLYKTYSTGFKASYVTERIAIIAKGHIIQHLEEDVCNPAVHNCLGLLSDCRCSNDIRLAHVIVITRDGFIPSTIKLRACVARRQ